MRSDEFFRVGGMLSSACYRPEYSMVPVHRGDGRLRNHPHNRRAELAAPAATPSWKRLLNGRSRWRKRLAIGVAVCALLIPSFARAAERPPNVLLIVADDLGYNDVGFQGSLDIPTPNLDGLARSSVRFTNAYVTHPTCSPSRAGLLTGRYQQRFGHEVNPEWSPDSTVSGLPLSETLLPQMLQQGGYATGCIGKWHLGAHPQFHPNRRGCGEYVGVLGGGHVYLPGAKGPPEAMAPLDRNGRPEPLTAHLTDVLRDEAVSFIRRHAGKPWFLYLSFTAPHTPLQPHERHQERVRHIVDPLRQSYAGLVVGLDEAVGAVLAALRESNQLDNTLIWFLSDNGGQVPMAHSSNAPLRGTKGEVYEGGIRVPFLLSWPGHVPAGSTFTPSIISLDIVPTTLAATKIPVPTSIRLEGVDLVPFATKTQAGVPHAALYWRVGFGRSHAVREGNWKLAATSGKPKLFDLGSDVSETRDLAAAHPERVERMKKAYLEWNKANTVPAFPGIIR